MNKDKITNICGALALIFGAVLASTQEGVVLHPHVKTICIIGGVVCGSVVAYFTGKPNTPKA